MNSQIRVADYIACRCVEEGLLTTFTVTGGGAMHLNDALGRNKKIKNYYFHHEQSAAMAADAFFRSSQKIPIVNVTTGPGGVNALNGIYGAYVDSLSVLVISGQVKKDTVKNLNDINLRQLGDQEVDIVGMSKDITKFSFMIDDADKIEDVLNLSFFLLKNGRPGPVWLDIPIDIQSAKINPLKLKKNKLSTKFILENFDLNNNTRNEIPFLFNKLKKREYLDKFYSLISNSKKPVILAGSGIRTSGSYKNFLNFINFIKFPVLTAWNAHDLIHNSSRLFCGRPGTVGDRGGNLVLQNADLIVVLGCRLNIRQISYNWKCFGENAKIVMIDIDSAELNKSTLSIDYKIHMNLSDFFDEFLRNKNKFHSNNNQKKFLKWSKLINKKFPVVLNSYKHSKNYLNPYLFIKELFNRLSFSDIIVTANGSACVMGFQAAEILKGQRLFTNSGSASMGYDLPAAIGASLSNMKKRVICISGDGSIMMNLQELETVKYLNLQIKIFIMNNGGYASIKQTQKNYFPDNIVGVNYKTGISFPSFSNLGKALGIQSVLIKNANDWNSGLVNKLLKSKKPAIFDVYVDPDQEFSPKLQSKMLSDGTMISPRLEDMYPFLDEDKLKSLRYV